MTRLHRPFKGPFTITQPFGPTAFEAEPPYNGFAHFHLGVDYALNLGTCILAPGFGTVLTTGWDETGFGNVITIDHGNGLVSLLAHLSEFRTRRGDKVNQGELVGLSGSTGNSTGPHLHWSTLYRGLYRDPALYVFAVD